MLTLNNIPFTSLAQVRYMYAKKPLLAKEFAAKTDFSSLLEKVSASKKKQKSMKKKKAKKKSSQRLVN